MYKDTRSWAEIQKVRDEAERLRAQEEQKRAEKEERIARWAERKWNLSEPAAAHPYLERKGVEAHGLRVDEKNRLVLPMRDLSGKIWSLQTISAEGEKHYTAGGRKKGLHTIVGAYDPAKPLAFAEGFATAASVYQATGLAAVIVFDSGNLKPVAEAYNARNTAQSFIFAADNDHHLPLKQSAGGRVLQNVGVEKAEEAARAVGGSVAIPNFERGNPGTDWNDYAAQHGLSAVREAFGGLLQITPGVADTPAIAKTERTALKQYSPSIERPLPHQEVSMPELQSTIARGVTQTERTEAEAGGAQRPQEIRHKRVTAVAELSTHGTATNTEGTGDTPPLERLSRTDVERALQTGASLAQKDLSGLDLSNLKFDGINLAGSNLSGTRNINTTYESSRLDGANFSNAIFRDSTIERVFAVNSRWDRTQFDRTNIVFSNFGNASFRDALFRDEPRSRDREEPTRKQTQNGGAPETEDHVQSVHKPGRGTWTEVAAHAGTFLKDIGKALKDVSVDVYHKVRDWWTQPLQLAPEIERNMSAPWAKQPPGYAAYEQPPAQAWAAPHAERVQAQSYADANTPLRSNNNGISRGPEQNKNQDGANQGHSAGTRSSGRPSQPSPDAAIVERERLQPALIARNNFQFADLTGARFESIRVQDNDFRHARLVKAHFPDELHKANKTTLKEAVEVKVTREANAREKASAPRERNTGESQSPQPSRQRETARTLPVEKVARLSWSYDGPASAKDLMATVEDLHRKGAAFLIHKNRYLSVAEISRSRDQFEEHLTKLDGARATESSYELERSARAAGWAAADLFGHLGLSRDESLSVMPVHHSLAGHPKLSAAFVNGVTERTRASYSEQEELYPGSEESIAARNEREEFLGRVTNLFNDRLRDQHERAEAESPEEVEKRNDEYYGRLGFSLDRGSSSFERAQAISEEADRLHDDLNATQNIKDRKDLINETKDLQAESVALRVEGQTSHGQSRESEKEEMPSLAMDQARFDALLSLGVFDEGKPVAWRMSMEEKVSARFHDPAAQPRQLANDHRGLWQEAAKQVQQGESLNPQGRDRAEDRGRDIDDQTRAQEHESHRRVALAR